MLRVALALLLLVPAPVFAARLAGVGIVPGTVTIIADGPPAVAYQMALGAPYRLVVDLPAVTVDPVNIPGAGSVTRVRLAMFSPGIARLVLDLATPLEIASARSSANGLALTLRRVADADFATDVRRGRHLLPVQAGGPLLVLPAAAAPGAADFDLPAEMFVRHAPDSGAVTAPPSALASPPASVVDNPDRSDSAAEGPPPPRPRAAGIRSRSGGKPLVVIDAGHGGKDVGAISINGRYEKDATLAIARATAKLIERHGKVRVQLTRADDRFIPLGGRVAIARQARADLFVSVHADSAPNADARGASVYTLSAVASDAVAARLAARENKADIIGGVNLGLEAPEVGDIMIDLSRRATGNVSVAFAEILQDELSDRIKFRGEFHHFAGFYVLKAPDVPSVLLETGYVTNTDDADILFSDAGRQRIAAGIAAAIERHLLGD